MKNFDLIPVTLTIPATVVYKYDSSISDMPHEVSVLGHMARASTKYSALEMLARAINGTIEEDDK